MMTTDEELGKEYIQNARNEPEDMVSGLEFMRNNFRGESGT